jgi:hypothetical protein
MERWRDIEREREKGSEGHTDIQTYIHTDIQTYRHTDIQTYIQTYRHRAPTFRLDCEATFPEASALDSCGRAISNRMVLFDWLSMR